MSPLFSVIVPAHNSSGYIRKGLDSIRAQSFPDYELIVICDACTDSTEEIAREYTDRVITITAHRDGLARNAGLDAARGQWVLFMDDDDWFLHEFVFAQLAEKLTGADFDVLFFGFVWRGMDVISTNRRWPAVWSKCWRRSFIGATRFPATENWSDVEFDRSVMARNPRKKYWNMPLYYYNYMREGSISWKEAQKPVPEQKEGESMAKFDLILTHYNEPWEVGKKFFDMIEQQQCVNLNDVNIMIVQDGQENALPWEMLLSDYSFRTRVFTMPEHRGTAAARNYGIENATSDWIMFVDFDDMFADVCTLAMLTDLFPVTNQDILWCPYVHVVKSMHYSTEPIINKVKEHDPTVKMKLYRRNFLNEQKIRFPEELPEHSEFMFSTLAAQSTQPFRIAKITLEFYPFIKTFRDAGAFSQEQTLRDMLSNLRARDIQLALDFRQRGNAPMYRHWLGRAICDSYYYSLPSTEPENNHGLTDTVREFYRKYKADIASIPESDMEIVMEDSSNETMAYIQRFYSNFQKEWYLANDMYTLQEWLELLEQSGQKHAETIENAPSEPVRVVDSAPASAIPAEPASHKNDRVVVYCGTRNTYVNMMASAKSILATTKIDRMYFLIEDDAFPYPLPDIIETRNVSNLHIFDENGPNYSNVWTYMCLMRAAFPKLFPQYDRILSLDIDVVATEDIGALWDIDLTDYYLSGVGETGRTAENGGNLYINFGVVMMNLKKLRDDRKDEEIIHALDTEKFGCPEQDAFNRLCVGQIHQMPNDYNVTVYSHITGEALSEKVLHYAGLKYWKNFTPVKRFALLDWPEVLKRQEAPV